MQSKSMLNMTVKKEFRTSKQKHPKISISLENLIFITDFKIPVHSKQLVMAIFLHKFRERFRVDLIGS
jgi:hypothetical protein